MLDGPLRVPDGGFDVTPYEVGTAERPVVRQGKAALPRGNQRIATVTGPIVTRPERECSGARAHRSRAMTVV
jgi:hypothetical protein